jgi:membrane fusion protein (multidrug efflux system)
MPRTLHYVTVLLFAALTFLTACNKQSDTKLPERVTQITAATAKTMNLPIVESATGAETALGFALDYDPTRVSGNAFYARLTFPEHVAAQLHVGQAVRLTSFGNEDKAVQSTIREIRPALNVTTLSREVIVAVRNGENWRPTGSIRGDVTLGVHKNAVVVPELAVVLRPAGTVVYIIENGMAREQPVKTGLMRDGVMEIVDGLQAGSTVAVDGAALLSPGAKISVRETPAREGGKPS